ncbi:CHASE domain-containing protein [Jutongia hominis]|uniref:CHASE domain-containing protein n=1 Tax=Jutongia hominis TaxID=2763664 RepID=UPI0020161FE5|nr:CHASE domain-containing protein [Jutongia hominis]
MYKRFRKKKIILPLLVFLSGMSILGLTTYHMIKEQQKHDRTLADLNAMIYAERMKADIEEGIRATDTLKQILISEEGRINKFEQVAKNMMTDYIQSIQIAPKGVVTEIYPIKGNELGKIDLINDKDRGQISRYAIDNQMIVMQGPFKMKQDGCGIAVRNPVYLKNKKGHRSFWGFTIVIIRVPDIFSDTINALMDFGYQY